MMLCGRAPTPLPVPSPCHAEQPRRAPSWPTRSATPSSCEPSPGSQLLLLGTWPSSDSSSGMRALPAEAGARASCRPSGHFGDDSSCTPGAQPAPQASPPQTALPGPPWILPMQQAGPQGRHRAGARWPPACARCIAGRGAGECTVHRSGGLCLATRLATVRYRIQVSASLAHRRAGRPLACAPIHPCNLPLPCRACASNSSTSWA